MGETKSPGNRDTFVADYNFTHPYVFVTGNAVEHCQLATDATTSSILGVIVTDPDSGQQGTVQFDGITKIYAGGALSVFDIVTTNGSGRAAACGSGDVPMGQILKAAVADGDIVKMRLHPPTLKGGAV